MFAIEHRQQCQSTKYLCQSRPITWGPHAGPKPQDRQPATRDGTGICARRPGPALGPTPLNLDDEINVWTKKLDVVIQQTPKHECGAALLQLAERCLTANQWDRWSVAIDGVSAHTPMSDCSRYGSLLTMRTCWPAKSFWPGRLTLRLDWKLMVTKDRRDQRLAGASKGKRLGSPQESDPFN